MRRKVDTVSFPWRTCCLILGLVLLVLLPPAGCGPASQASAPRAVASTEVAAASTRGGPTAPTEPASADPKAEEKGGAPEALPALTLAVWLKEGRDLVLVDVRPDSRCGLDGIPGALCIPLKEMEARHSELPRGKQVVVYGRGSGEDDSADVKAAALLLLARGFPTVYELEGGLNDYLMVAKLLESGACNLGCAQ